MRSHQPDFDTDMASGQSRSQVMRQFKSARAIAMALFLFFGLTALQSVNMQQAFADSSDSALKATSLTDSQLQSEGKFAPKINKKALKLAYKKSATLKVTGTSGKKVKWTTSKKSIIKIKTLGSSKAKITAIGSGTAKVTAKVGGKKLTCKVTVPLNPELSDSNLNLTYGSSTTLSVTGNNEKKVVWSSSNPSIVKVKSSGKNKGIIEALQAGNATITAKVGNKRLVCSVKVVGYLSDTAIDSSSFDNTKQLYLYGATAASWESSDEDYLTVNSSGIITHEGLEGSATVTCTDTWGNKYTCEVNTTLPNIECTMDKTLYQTVNYTTYYYKRFTFSNSSGRAVRLAKSIMLYWPFGSTDTRALLLGLAGTTTLTKLDDSPITVRNGYYFVFDAFEGTSRYSIYSNTTFGMTIQVDGYDYTCIFRADGTLLVCSRSN